MSPPPDAIVNPARSLGRIADFTLIRIIGDGGMGTVYEAVQDLTDRPPVALKKLKLAGVADPQREIRRFRKEASAMEQLEHPNIVPVFSVGEDRQIHYLTMKLIRGVDLSRVISNARSRVTSFHSRQQRETPRPADVTIDAEAVPAIVPETTSPLPQPGCEHAGLVSDEFVELTANGNRTSEGPAAWHQITQIGIQAAEALHHAHELGIVHRDIKPANLLLDEDHRLWVTDFGLARVAGVDGQTLPGQLMGTLRYMSPEQALSGRVIVDKRTDIFSLGVTLYEFLTLSRAFPGESQQEVIHNVCFYDPPLVRRRNPAVPEQLETIVAKAMAKAPEERYQTAQELADDLRRFENQQRIQGRRPTVVQHCRRWLRRHRVLATAAAVILAVVSVTSTASALIVWNSLLAETQAKQQAHEARKTAEVARDDADSARNKAQTATAVALDEKSRAEAARQEMAVLLRRSEGLRLLVTSSLKLGGNPGLAMALAVLGAEYHPSLEANQALLEALGALQEIRMFVPREDARTYGAAISPDGRRCVTTVSPLLGGKGGFPAIVSDLATGETVLSLDDGGAMTQAIYSPDGRFILTASAPDSTDGSQAGDVALSETVVALRDALTGAHKVTFPEAVSVTASSHAFSPTGDLVVLPAKDQTAIVASTADGLVRQTLRGHRERVVTARFSPGGNWIVTIGADSTVRLWDTTQGTQLAEYPTESRSPADVAVEFVGDRPELLIADASGTRLCVITAEKPSCSPVWPQPMIVVSPGGRVVAAFRRFEKTVSIRDMATRELVSTIEVAGPIDDVRFSFDGTRVAVASHTDAAVFGVADGELKTRLQGHTARVRSVRFTPDDSRILSTSDDGTVRVWFADSFRERSRIADLERNQIPAPFGMTRNAESVVTTTGAVFRSELRDGKGEILPGQLEGRLDASEVTTDQIVTTTEHGAVVWDLQTFQKRAETRFEFRSVSEAILVPETDLAILLMNDGPAVLWDWKLDTQRPVGNPDDVGVAFSVDPLSGRVALGMRNGRCLLLNVRSGSTPQRLPHDDPVLLVSFCRNGRLLTIDDDNTARVWMDNPLEPAITIQPAGVKFDRGLLTPDGNSLLTWTDVHRDVVRCWRVDTGELKLTGETSFSGPQFVTHPQRPLVSVSSRIDGTVLWNFETGEERRMTESATASTAFLGERLLVAEPAAEPRTGAYPWISQHGPGQAMLSVWNLDTAMRESHTPVLGQPFRIAVNQKRQQFLLTAIRHEASEISIRNGTPTGSFADHAGPIVFLGFVAGDRRIVSASWDGTVNIRDTDGNTWQSQLAHQHPIITGATRPDGSRFATVDMSGHGIVWDALTGRAISQLVGHTAPIHAVRFLGNKNQIMTASGDRTVRIWDTETGIEQRQFEFGQGILAAEPSPDGDRLLVVPGEEVVALRSENRDVDGVSRRIQKPEDAADALLIRIEDRVETRLVQDGQTQLAHFSPDGRLIVLISAQGTATVLQTETGALQRSIGWPEVAVRDAQFSTDGLQLATRHDYRTSFWNLETGLEIVRMSETEKTNRSLWVPFCSETESLTTAGFRLRRWPRVPLTLARQQAPRQLTTEERREFLFDLADGDAAARDQPL